MTAIDETFHRWALIQIESSRLVPLHNRIHVVYDSCTNQSRHRLMLLSSPTLRPNNESSALRVGVEGHIQARANSVLNSITTSGATSKATSQLLTFANYVKVTPGICVILRCLWTSFS